MNFFEKKKIGFFGSADGNEILTLKHQARIIGAEVAKRGAILCTGACHGLPHEAAFGADMHNGMVFGFSPAINMEEHISKGFPVEPYNLIFTGMGQEGRSLICTRSCDAAIFIAGRWGTMIEFSLMCDEGKGKIISLLSGSGGFVDDAFIPSLKKSEKVPRAITIVDKDPMVLIDEIFKTFNYLVRFNSTSTV